MFKKKETTSVTGPSTASGILYNSYRRLRQEAAKVKILKLLRTPKKKFGSFHIIIVLPFSLNNKVLL